MRTCLVFAVSLTLCLSACRATAPDRADVDSRTRVAPNDNRRSAGELRDGVLALHLEVREARWFPDGDDASGEMVQVFAEEGRVPQIPGPLIRVPAGTRIQATIRNPLADSTLIVYGLNQRPGSASDTLQVAPGGKREVSFTAGEPGTYFYWGTTTHASLENRQGIDSQLHGAFVVDSVGTDPSGDRVFVLGAWGVPPDSSGPPPYLSRDLRVINGLSWPHTERFAYNVGDTVRWRWVNPTAASHPLHLHGFYFDVHSRGTWAADTVYLAGDERRAVTESTLPGGTFSMRWVPEEPGNWLLHCHLAFHVSHFLSLDKVPEPPDPVATESSDHSVHGMRGMMLGISVAPGKSSQRRPTATAGARALRLIAQSAPRRYLGKLDGLAYVLQQGDRAPAADSVPVPSSPIILRRGEPVAITVVNHMRAPTAVHWHGMEIPSYPDGVPSWSGGGKKLAPMIAPGDSFVAAFTPPRAGTFIYHSHSNELFQISLGLYGPLVVVDPDTYDPAHERLFILGGNGLNGWSYGNLPKGEPPARINGKSSPDTVRLVAGESYRLRLIHIQPDYTTRFTLRHGERTLQWRALAKDGADLPSSQRIVKPATMMAGPGETADFEFTPTAPGVLTLEVRAREGEWTIRVPMLVQGIRG